MKDIDALDGARALLLLAEDQVDPLVQVRADVVTLKRLSINQWQLRHAHVSGTPTQLTEQRIAKRRYREARYDAPRDELE